MTTLSEMEKAIKIMREAEKQLDELFGCSVTVWFNLYERNLEKVLQVVCEVTGQTMESLKSENRKNEIVFARYYAYKLIRTHLKYTMASIGKIFNRDHSTITTGLQTFEELHQYSPGFRDQYDKAEALLLERILL